MKPLAIDLFCGLGGWTEGLQAEGWQVIGIDNEAHVYGEHRYPGDLVLADVRALHGAWFKDADLLVASPPCQAYSYMAMPWKLGKAKAAAIRADATGEALAGLNELFDACFRIQREASAAKGEHVPMIVENVRGAQPWVGGAVAHYGSFYLWGDVPALMPQTLGRQAKVASLDGGRRSDVGKGAGFTSRDCGGDGRKLPGFRFDGSGRSFQSASVEGVKSKDTDGYERDHPAAFGWKAPRTSSTNVSARKFASAMIAKIPVALSRHIGATFYPRMPSRSRTHAPEAAAVASPGGPRCRCATSASSEC